MPPCHVKESLLCKFWKNRHHHPIDTKLVIGNVTIRHPHRDHPSLTAERKRIRKATDDAIPSDDEAATHVARAACFHTTLGVAQRNRVLVDVDGTEIGVFDDVDAVVKVFFSTD